MNRVEELEQAIRTALDQFDAWAQGGDGDVPTLDYIFLKLEAALIDDDTLIGLVQP